MAQTTIAGKFLDPTVISALTEVSADSANDFLLAWDATNSTLTKVKPDNLGMGAATIKTTYASHGLNVGDVIKSSGTADQFNVALATTAAGAEVVGVVTAVSGNDVTITISGEIDYAGNTGFSYLSGAGVGTIVFLSHSSAGDLSATEPSAVGHISKPLAVVIEAYSANSAGKIVLIIQRGEIISTGTDTKAPNDATYVTTTSNSSLTNEVLTSALKIDDFAAGDDNTDLDSSAARHGLLRKLDGTTTNFLRGDGAWAAAGGDLSFGGDTFGADKIIGSNDAYALSFETAGVVRMKIHGQVTDPTSAGAITMPTQPAAFVRRGAGANNVTGAGTVYTMVFTSVVFDQGDDWDDTSTFTAPVTGRYHMDVYLDIASMTSSANAFLMDVVMSNRSLSVNTLPMVANPARYAAMVSMLVDLDVNDELQVRLTVSGESSNIVDLNSNTCLGIYLAA